MVPRSLKKCSYILVLGMLMPVHMHAWLPSPAAFCSAIANVVGKIARPLSPYASQGVSIIANNSGKFALAFAALAAAAGFVLGSRRKRSIAIVQDNLDLEAQIREQRRANLEQQAQQIQAFTNELEAEKNGAIRAAAGYEALIDQESDNIKKRDERIGELSEDLEKVKSKNKTLRGELNFARAANEAYYVIDQEHRERIETLSKEFKALGNELRKIRENREAEKAAYSESKAGVVRLSAQNEQLRNELGQQETERGYRLSELTREVKETEAELARLRKDCAARDQELKEARERAGDLQEQLQDKAQENSAFEEVYNNSFARYRELEDKFRTEKTRRKEFRHRTEEELARLRKELAQREQQLSCVGELGRQREAQFNKVFAETEVRNLYLKDALVSRAKV